MVVQDEIGAVSQDMGIELKQTITPVYEGVKFLDPAADSISVSNTPDLKKKGMEDPTVQFVLARCQITGVKADSVTEVITC
jgi:hypothetical protein